MGGNIGMLSNEPVLVVGLLNELMYMTKRTTTKPDVAYVVIRSHYNGEEWIGETPVAICEFLEDADNMATKYNQEMLDRNIDSLSFNVIVCPFYD